MHLHTLIDPFALRQDGSKPLTADWDAGPYKLTARQFESDVTTGTAPLIVASTTLVTNLNADYWDGYQFADYLDQAVKTTSSPTFVTGTFTDIVVDTNLIKTVSATNRIGFNVTSPTVSFDFLGTMLLTGPSGVGIGDAPTAFTFIGGEGEAGAKGGPGSIRAGDGGDGDEESPDGGAGGILTIGGGAHGGSFNAGDDGSIGYVDVVTDMRFPAGARLVSSDFLVPSGSRILLTAPTESDIAIGGFGTASMYIQGQTNDKVLSTNWFTQKGDGGDHCYFQIYGVGTLASQTTYENLWMGYVGSATPANRYTQVWSYAGGDGTVRPLKLGTGANTDQLVIATDGSVNIGSTANYTKIKTDGEINLHGTARVTNALWIGANGVKAPPTKPAAFVDHGISGAWEFSDATDDTIVANMRIPNRMDIGVAPSISLGWSSTTTSAFCEWQIEYLWRSANDDTTAGADDTLLSSTDADASTSSGTAEGMVLSTFPLAAPLATDVCLHLRIKRRGDLDADTINGDTVELHGICLSFTSNKLGLAT